MFGQRSDQISALKNAIEIWPEIDTITSWLILWDIFISGTKIYFWEKVPSKVTV